MQNDYGRCIPVTVTAPINRVTVTDVEHTFLQHGRGFHLDFINLVLILVECAAVSESRIFFLELSDQFIGTEQMLSFRGADTIPRWLGLRACPDEPKADSQSPISGPVFEALIGLFRIQEYRKHGKTYTFRQRP